MWIFFSQRLQAVPAFGTLVTTLCTQFLWVCLPPAGEQASAPPSTSLPDGPGQPFPQLSPHVTPPLPCSACLLPLAPPGPRQPPPAHSVSWLFPSPETLEPGMLLSAVLPEKLSLMLHQGDLWGLSHPPGMVHFPGGRFLPPSPGSGPLFGGLPAQGVCITVQCSGMNGVAGSTASQSGALFGVTETCVA